MLAAADPGEAFPRSPATAVALALACRMDRTGSLSISRSQLGAAEPRSAQRLLSAACLCAAGTTRPPRARQLQRLSVVLSGPGPVVASLAGARIEADDEVVRLSREPGEAARGGLPDLPLPPNRWVVWDGRFEVMARRSGLTVRPLAGYAARLAHPERQALRAVPATARGALPAVLRDGRASSPVLAPDPEIMLRPLALDRLLGACGAVVREPL
jgi:tRNA(Ile)-lysidine synthase